MITYWIKYAIISFLIILFMHFFYDYFKNSLTEHKVIDLASEKQNKEVNKIIEENNKMENELSQYLKKELKNS